MRALAARRRHPMATAVLVMIGLVFAGLIYAAATPGRATAAPVTQDDVQAGKALFLANCSTCHGTNGEGRRNAPSLVGVGAAAVDFQVGTGRMPMQATGPQAPKAPKVQFTEEQIRQMAAYVASLGPGPTIPSAEQVDPAKGNVAEGASIFRTNCAMCHGSQGKGGALTRGKWAPSLRGVTPVHTWEAMATGPQSMPVFNNTLTDENKRDVIAYLDTLDTAPTPGGLSLGAIGPVSEGLVAWLVGIGALIGCAVWLGAKSS